MRVVNIKLIIALLIFSTVSVFSQVDRGDQVQMILTKYKNYRYGSVNVYEVLDPSEVKAILDEKKAAAGGGVNMKDAEELLKSIEPDLQEKIKNGVLEEKTPDEIMNDIILQGGTPPPLDQLKAAYDYFLSQIQNQGVETILHVYIISTVPDKIGEAPDEIIGAVVVENEFDVDTEKLKENLQDVAASDVYSYRRLRDEDIDEGTYGYKNMYELVYSYFIQGNVTNKSMEAKGIGTDEQLFTKAFGVSESLVDYNRYNGTLRSSEINSFMRISAQDPIDYRAKYQILSVAPDNISWTKYEKKYVQAGRGKLRLDSLGNPILDTRDPSNSDLPNFGFELDYGAEDVNFPSFWSERLTASAFWRNVKFGLILPTHGWSSLSEDVLDQNRTLTHGGFGVAGQLDFPIAVIQRSEVFHFSFGYVFGDAREAQYRDRPNYNIDNGILPGSNEPSDYLLRTNATLLYTFGMSIDQDYLLRFGIGGSYYNMEQWYYRTQFDMDDMPSKVSFGNQSSESVGGVALKLDFIAKNPRTPFGTTFNFFDGVIYVDAFVQVPVISNTFSIKVNAKGNYITRGTLRPWEPVKGFFQPNVALIYAF